MSKICPVSFRSGDQSCRIYTSMSVPHTAPSQASLVRKQDPTHLPVRLREPEAPTLTRERATLPYGEYRMCNPSI